MNADPQSFWNDPNPCDHTVQIYDSDDELLDALEAFVVTGLGRDESVIVIATSEHRGELQRRLVRRGIDVWAAMSINRYLALDAEATLSLFMRGGWPDDQLFVSSIGHLIARGRAEGRAVRAFGEMVAVLWARNEVGATLRLEALWHRLCREWGFPLFCAYPRQGFHGDTAFLLNEICVTHDRRLGIH
jgi:hypothetical protein